MSLKCWDPDWTEDAAEKKKEKVVPEKLKVHQWSYLPSTSCCEQVLLLCSLFLTEFCLSTLQNESCVCFLFSLSKGILIARWKNQLAQECVGGCMSVFASNYFEGLLWLVGWSYLARFDGLNGVGGWWLPSIGCQHPELGLFVWVGTKLCPHDPVSPPPPSPLLWTWPRPPFLLTFFPLEALFMAASRPRWWWRL